ncbi:MAG: UDP-N-acetylmuramoyl-tripeptide--D-alanyl-D-alanine ligase [Sulfurovum sp.]
MLIINSIAYGLFIIAIGYYFITNLQWYSYKLSRVLFHHTKLWWHYIYFLFPFLLYAFINPISEYSFVVVVVYLALIISWYRGLDKPLVFTGRVKRFFVVLLFVSGFVSFTFEYFAVVLPLFIAYVISAFIEMMLFSGFKTKAEKKIDSMSDMIVVGVTASYGKTSIKNYIEHLLKAKYKTYATPRSVNTLGGVILDINRDLPDDTEVYIVEMGARGEGDIAEISTFVNPHFVVVGKIGPAHIEYFKTIEKIRNTKMEILKTDRLKQAWVHESARVKPEAIVHTFGSTENLDIRTILPAPEFVISDIEATLDKTSFKLNGVEYSANILGKFNAMNLASAVLVATELGLSTQEIQDSFATLQPVAHRLQRIDAGGKVILDDSFNGNIDGMMASFDLVSQYKGRKVVLTPGLVEVDDDLNIEVAKRANEVFDLVIVTGDLNYGVFKKYIDEEKLLKLASKSDMEDMLVTQTTVGDLILFANDAPSFV